MIGADSGKLTKGNGGSAILAKTVFLDTVHNLENECVQFVKCEMCEMNNDPSP